MAEICADLDLAADFSYLTLCGWNDSIFVPKFIIIGNATGSLLFLF